MKRAHFIALLLTGGILGISSQSPAETTMKIRVGVHKQLQSAISQSDVQKVLERAEYIIRDKNGTRPDVACPIKFVLNGAVSYDPKIPYDFADWSGHKEARSLGYQLIFLPAMSNCGGSGGAIGCTWMGGGVATVLASAADNNLVVAHELGHARGLDDVEPPFRIMQWVANPGNDTLTQKECDVYDGPLAAMDPNAPEPPLPKHNNNKTSDLSIPELLEGQGFIHGVMDAYPSIEKRCAEDLSEARKATSSDDFNRRGYAYYILGRCGSEEDIKLWDATLSTEIGSNFKILKAQSDAIFNSGVVAGRTGSQKASEIYDKYLTPSPSLPDDGTDTDDGSSGLPKRLISSTHRIAAVRASAVSNNLLVERAGKPAILSKPELYGLRTEDVPFLKQANEAAKSGNIAAAVAAALNIRGKGL
ncbi:hypothetical protein [Methylobacterium sp. Leaf361]|uniref:hypothetical protein n=1 Tax=Methylobacterium sp. Leaf361 TaxID=1736352 RepID=UPI000ACA0192|nr:hypothetical protein [Methylobacterium sp. Leaf361]